MYRRVIARLDIKGPNLVKGVHLEGLRVLGKPEQYAKIYYEQGADELIYMDAVASLYGRNSLLDIIARTSREIFIPLTVAGGLRSIDDISAVLRSGADKVAINTAAVKNPELIREAATKFGSSTIVVAIEAIRRPDGSYEAYTDCGRESTGVDAMSWARRAAELGAGEILLTSIDREGTGRGYDLELVRKVSESVPIPVIAHGGAGKLDDVADAFLRANADAVCVASLLHYHYVKTIPYEQAAFKSEGNIEFLQKSATFGRIQATSLPELKSALAVKGVLCRS